VATDANHFGQDVPGTLRGRPDLTALHRRAREELARVLAPDEQPRLVIAGLGTAAIIATDWRVLVFKRGARAGLAFGWRLKSFEYESVMRVDIKRAGDFDIVVIHAPSKISSCSSYWADARDDPWRARNAIPVGRASVEAERAVGQLSRLVAAVHDRAKQVAESRDVAEHVTRIEDSSPRVGVSSASTATERILPAGPVFEDCPRCANRLRVGWEFCPRCGAPAKSGAAQRMAGRRRRRSP
jgi:hypothetical protein